MQVGRNFCSRKDSLCMCTGAGKQASRVYSAAQKEVLEKCAEFVENVIIHREFDDLDAFRDMFKEVSSPDKAHMQVVCIWYGSLMQR